MTATNTTRGPAIDGLIDWELALRTAAAVTRPGPVLAHAEAVAAVAALREAAAVARPHVVRVSRLDAPAGAPPLVVDRAGWAKANVHGFRTILAPVVDDVVERRGKPLIGLGSGIGSRITGAELGGLLGFLSGRVLGQYDPFADPGRLLLVAPNIVHVEQELGVDPADFRLWVALHEETHRVQFSATPWLTEHILTEIRSLVGDLLIDPGQLVERVASVVRHLPDVVRGADGAGAGLLSAVQTPEQREHLARLTAIMSLLEGHADVVMDEVGPAVIPSVSEIRRKFTRRRAGRGAVDQLLRRLLGLDAKMRQYADGARFVRGVSAKVGTAGFNAVWTDPDHLPLPAEIANPSAWVRRVHG
jgi:coenzyme F420 biosynthesis associated uncharacterized protein